MPFDDFPFFSFSVIDFCRRLRDLLYFFVVLSARTALVVFFLFLSPFYYFLLYDLCVLRRLFASLLLSSMLFQHLICFAFFIMAAVLLSTRQGRVCLMRHNDDTALLRLLRTGGTHALLL